MSPDISHSYTGREQTPVGIIIKKKRAACTVVTNINY